MILSWQPFNFILKQIISKLIGCSKTSLCRWVNAYNEQGVVISQHNRTRKSYKVRKVHVQEALSLLQQNKQISMKELHDELSKRFSDLTITPRWLGHVLRDNNMTRKRTRIHHEPAKRFGVDIDFKKEVIHFYDQVRQYSLDRIICLDETSIQSYMIHTYSRCHIGNRCVEKTSDNAVFKKCTLLAAISSNGLVGYTLCKQGGMTAERFVEFLNKHVKDKFKDYLIILDNAGSHKNNLVKNAIVQMNNKYLFTPPYYPEANAIENWFSQLKNYLKRLREVSSFEKLENNIKDA